METPYETSTGQLETDRSKSAVAYDSACTRAKIVVGFFIAGILLATLTVICNFELYQLMDRIGHGETVTESQLKANDVWRAFLAGAFLFWYLVTIVAFLMWEHRAHRNLPSLGATGLEFSPRGAVGWYFVPFLNLFKPYQVMREIYNASQPDPSDESSIGWRGRNAPFGVKTWWALFLFMNFVSNAVGRAGVYADTHSAFQFVAVASMLAETIGIAAMVAALSVVRSVTRRQESRADVLGVSG